MTLNVSLTPHLEEFVHADRNLGRYRSASEVVRTAAPPEDRERSALREIELAATRNPQGARQRPCHVPRHGGGQAPGPRQRLREHGGTPP